MMRDGEENWREYVARMANIDWRRSASIWSGNVVSDDGSRVLTAHKSFGAGVQVLKAQIGWQPKVEGEVDASNDSIQADSEVETAQIGENAQ